MTRCFPPLLAALLLSSCQQPGQRATPASEAGQVQRQDAVEYQIDPTASELRILVYRAGPLARLGHNHVIIAKGVTGHVYLQEPLGRSGFQFSFPVDALQVDPTAARREEGADFATLPSPVDIQGTRSNLLGERVLNGSAFPRVSVQGLSLSGTPPQVVLNCRILLRGALREISVPATLTLSEREIRVSGELALSHSQLGLTPFSVMLGALQVGEKMTLKFKLQATRS